MKLHRGILVNGLIALLGVSSLVAVLATTGLINTKDRADREQNLFPVFNTEDVSSLDLTQNGQQVRLVRGPSTEDGSAAFELTKPVKERADADAVEKLLNALASAKALRPADASTKVALGLTAASPRLSVSLGKSNYELTLGGPVPAPAGARYVEVKPVGAAAQDFVIEKSLVEDLSFGLNAFRLRGIVPLAEADVRHITLESPTLQIALTRGKERRFFIDGIPSVRADRSVVSALFFQLGRLSADRFLTQAEAEAALGSTRTQLSLEARDPSQSVRLDAGGNCPGNDAELVIERRAPSLQSACTSRELDGTLGRTRDSFVDLHPFSLRTDEVEELKVASGQTQFRLVRQGTAFLLHAKTDSDITLEAGNQRVTDVLDVIGTRIPSPNLAELGLEPSQGTVTLRSSASSEADVIEEVVRVGNKNANGDLHVLREVDGVVLTVPRDHARAFTPDASLLYDKKLTAFGPSSFISAEIERPGGTEVLIRGAHGEPELTQPKGFHADGSLSGDVIQALGALEAERFVADADDGSFGFAHSTLTVRFAYKTDTAPKVERTLHFGGEAPLGVYAKLDDQSPVFTLPRSLRDTLDTLLIDRSVFTMDQPSLAGFSLKADGHTLQFERHGEHFESTRGQSFPSDRVADLLDAIGDLRPEAALHTGPGTPAEGFARPILVVQLTPQSGPEQTLTFGAGDAWRGTSIFYLRVAGVNATYVVAQSKVRALLAAF